MQSRSVHDKLCAQALQHQHAALQAAGAERGFAAEAPGWADVAATLAAAATHARGVVDELQRMARAAAGGSEAAGAEPQEGQTAGGAAGAPGGPKGLSGAAGSAQGALLGGNDASGSPEEGAARWAEDAERAVDALLLWAQALPQSPDSACPSAAHYGSAPFASCGPSLLGALTVAHFASQCLTRLAYCLQHVSVGQFRCVHLPWCLCRTTLIL